MNYDETTTYKQSENAKMAYAFEHPYSEKEMVHPRTKNWHACFGTHSALGCDGCDHWGLCMELTFNNGWRREEKVKGIYFLGLVIITEEL